MDNEQIKELAYDMANKTIIYGNYKNFKEARANFPICFVKFYNLEHRWFEHELIYWSERWRSNYFTHNADGEKKLKNTWIRAIYNNVNINNLRNNNTRNNNTRNNIQRTVTINNQTESNLIANALLSLRNNL